MTTDVLTLDPEKPDPTLIARAAAVVRAGGLVAIPTETVYGLAANALDAGAVARIFAAKGRPATNPVIVHVADVNETLNVAAAWPATAAALAARFWPGPLTLVLPRGRAVPDVVTAGGPTVAVRCPDHAVARALIRAAGVPLAAPSANRSTELSPTRAEHVQAGLNGRIDLILDAGPCRGGIESTVVDVSGDEVRILRPGLVTAPMLEAVIGHLASPGRESRESDAVARSPGQMQKHYSPRTPVVLVPPGTPVGSGDGLVRLTSDPTGYAAALYDQLHRFDAVGYVRIVVEMPPDTPEWAAVRDRLTRAASSA